jgi:hypothetical protein
MVHRGVVTAIAIESPTLDPEFQKLSIQTPHPAGCYQSVCQLLWFYYIILMKK